MAVLLIGVLFVLPSEGYVNLARNDNYRGQASQSSSYPNYPWTADKAVDGHLQGTTENSCSFTKGDRGIQTAWWKFPLKQSSNVAYIEIFFGKASVDRHAGFSVFVFNDTSFVPPFAGGYKVFTLASNTCPNQTMNITINKVTKGIALFNSNQPRLKHICAKYDDNFASIEICEVYVMGCQAGHFGPRCIYCDKKCLNRQCDVFNGSCIYGCSNPVMEPPNCTVCKRGKEFYGLNCEHTCGKCKPGTFCNSTTGICPNSCQDHWNGEKCDMCSWEYYGPNCELNCGKCKARTSCHKTTGHCLEGCKNHWNGSKCDVCSWEYYGPNCELSCGKCKARTSCHKTNGHCLEGCQNHWNGSKCDVCKHGFYSSDCGHTCGKCKTGTHCNNITGICPVGCRGHWGGQKCDVCERGFYGQGCATRCGNCSKGTFCDNRTGICHEGCRDNWAGEKCDACEQGFYGTDCGQACGHCKTGTYCNNITGICPNGCLSHWDGHKCEVCRNGFYGQECLNTCGNCKTETHCNNITGICDTGCKEHWNGTMCDRCSDGFYGENCSMNCGHCKNETSCNNITGVCHNGCQKHWNGTKCETCSNGMFGDRCNILCGNCNETNPVCAKTTGICLFGCQKNWNGSKCDVHLGYLESPEEQTDNAALIGGTLSVVVLLLLVGLFLLLFYRRYRNGGSKKSETDAIKTFELQSGGKKRGENQSETFDDVCTQSHAPTSSDDDGYYNTVQINTSINIMELQDVMLEKSKYENRQFLAEYKRLPSANVNVCTAAKKTENAVKNRFKTTFPYEHSRVTLKELWNNLDNDYINANYIKDLSGDIAYIAAQGPKNNTLVDFWRMIWQEKVKDIVMLTNIIENGKNKCTQYWPAKGKAMSVGPCKVALLEETTYSFHVIRTFSVQRKDTHDKRTISQFHYTAWPDHGTPEELNLVQFHKVVSKRKHCDAPLLVHCSAGVGRTGTFIGLDSLLKQGREAGRINVFEFVKQMREDRMTMVQTPEQYIFFT